MQRQHVHQLNMHSHVMSHLEMSFRCSMMHSMVSANAILVNSQFILTVQDLAKGLNDGEQIDAVLLDFFNKTFDKVPHKRQLEKLRHYGVRDSLNQWIADFLTDRQQGGPGRCPFQGNRRHIRRAPGDSTWASALPCLHK